ncbi:hypothetical protein BJY00DRAFT_250533 [Aspergillus carlsbadensis]|nr:hypothetical protein BJY00DRAFT_250533 [Aspergillus carlsbadensis]
MSAQTSFYPADPLENSAVAPSSLLLSNGFNQEFLNLALLEQPTHGMPMQQFPPNTQQAHLQGIPEPASQNDTPRSRLRNRQLRPAPRDSRKRSLADEMNPAPPPFLQYPSYTNFSSISSASTDHNEHSPEQDFAFDDARSHRSYSSSPKSSPTTHSFRHDEVEKREKHLERNRAAASKSRQKKKRETDQLKTRFNEASRKKRFLEEEIKGLHSDLLFLKDQILMHSRCDDEAIHVYLGRMVKQATKHGSMSSALTEEDMARSMSPPETEMHGRPEQPVLDMASPGSGPAPGPVPGQAPGGMPCGVEKPLIDPMMYQPAGNIFDYQISIS